MIDIHHIHSTQKQIVLKKQVERLYYVNDFSSLSGDSNDRLNLLFFRALY
jgi:hypothetical protein